MNITQKQIALLTSVHSDLQIVIVTLQNLSRTNFNVQDSAAIDDIMESLVRHNDQMQLLLDDFIIAEVLHG